MNLVSTLTYVLSLISIAFCAPPMTPENNFPVNSNIPQVPKKATHHVNLGNLGNVAIKLESKFDEVSTSNEMKKCHRNE